MSVSPTAESQLKMTILFVCILISAKSYMNDVCCNIVNCHDKLLLILCDSVHIILSVVFEFVLNYPR